MSLTQLIHKNGETDNPSLTSNLSKLFNSILHTRLSEYLEVNKLIRLEQDSKRFLNVRPHLCVTDHNRKIHKKGGGGEYLLVLWT